MDDVEKIKQKLDIVDVIGSYLQLKKAGRNFKTNCPFHNEKSPSFVISQERQIWHCFGCNKGGDVFTFLQEYENISFAEALKDLAEKANVKLTKPVFASEKEKKQDLIYSLNHLSSQFYNYLLLSHPSGKRALDYLISERKMTIPLIKTFMLGYAPTNNSLSTYLTKKKKYDPQDLITAGLSYKRGSETIDFFKERIIFPITDHRGNVVAFSGRAIRADQTPKYVNTKETPVYIKGDTLYGLHLSREGIKKEGKVIIVEGEFDVITAHKEGIINIVAVKGTALTENQIKLLKRFTNKFAFCFDTDPAGTEAQRRSIQLIEKEGITATVIIPPQGKDADEILKENPIAFKKAVRDDVNVYDFIIDSAIAEYDENTAEGKANILNKTLVYLDAIENEVIKEHYFKKLADKLNTSYESVQKQAGKVARKAQILRPSEDIPPKAQLPREEIIEIYLLSLIFQSADPKDSLERVKKVMSDVKLSTPSLQKVLDHLDKFEAKQPFSPKDFANFLPSELHISFDTAYLSPIAEFVNEQAFRHELEKTALQARKVSAKKRLKELSALISAAEKEHDNDNLERYQQEFSNVSKLLAIN